MGQMLGAFCGGCFEGVKTKAPDQSRYHEVAYTHLHPAPEGSLCLLGGISIEVPDEKKAKLFYSDLLGCPKTDSDVLSVTVGASRIVCPAASQAYAWPGEVRIWVEDLRETNDMLHMLGPTLGTDLLQDFTQGVDFGMYEMLVLCPFNANSFRVAETPANRAAALRTLFPPTAAGQRRTNVLALVDAVHYVPKGMGLVETVAHFYEQALSGTVTKRSNTFCIVHFSPSKDLHQTLKFIEDPKKGSSGAGSVCIYLATHEAFKSAFEKAEVVGDLPWVVADGTCEFHVKTHAGKPLPLEHVIRWTKHKECILKSQ